MFKKSSMNKQIGKRKLKISESKSL